MASEFGGATSVPARGVWLSADGTLVTEDVTIVYSFTENLSKEQLERVRVFCLNLKQELEQEAIAVEIAGKLRFVL